MEGSTAPANDRALELLELGPRPDGEPRTILEVGFGQGRTVAIVLGRGHRVLGVDPSIAMVRQATARNRRAVRDGRAILCHGDGVTIPFADDAVDAAYTVHTVYFMPVPVSTFAEVARVLRPGGEFVVACRTSDTRMPSWMDPAVYRIPTAAQLATMLHESGFDRVDHRVVEDAGPELHLFAARRTDASAEG
jgi:ubiquinone/menaquinone biosynthesis C-methylase UbiE